MNPRIRPQNHLVGNAELSHALRDPIVPLDFGGWVRRVGKVCRQNFRRLGTLAVAPLGLMGLYLIIGDLAKPDPDEIKQRLLAEIAAHPGEKVSLTTQFWILYGRTMPISVVFGILILAAGILYQACGHYLVFRHANGRPTSLTEAFRATKRRMLPFLGQSILAALILVVGALTPPILGTVFLPDGTKIVGNVVAGAVIVFLSTVFWATLGGVVLVDRAGIGRCFRLVRPQFWATFARMLLVGLIYAGFATLFLQVILLATPADGELGNLGATIAFTAILILCIPVMVFQVAASVVSYAELRFHEDPATSARTLLAEMVRL